MLHLLHCLVSPQSTIKNTRKLITFVPHMTLNSFIKHYFVIRVVGVFSINGTHTYVNPPMTPPIPLLKRTVYFIIAEYFLFSQGIIFLWGYRGLVSNIRLYAYKGLPTTCIYPPPLGVTEAFLTPESTMIQPSPPEVHLYPFSWYQQILHTRMHQA